MFPRRHRISRSQFPRAIKRGKRFSSKNLSVVIPQEMHGYAVVVSKKTARLSTTRHKIKRRVLAALRAIHLPPALIVFPRLSAGSVSYQDIRAELADLLAKNTNTNLL